MEQQATFCKKKRLHIVKNKGIFTIDKNSVVCTKLIKMYLWLGQICPSCFTEENKLRKRQMFFLKTHFVFDKIQFFLYHRTQLHEPKRFFMYHRPTRFYFLYKETLSC